jgi:hypothetical protein
MGTTSDRNDPRLTHGADDGPTPQAEVYLVLSDEERAKGFVRPVRRSYIHVGPPGPRYDLEDLTEHQKEIFGGPDRRERYVKFEPYPHDPESSNTGRFWTQEQLDAVGKGCGSQTRMSQDIAETYARSPLFYGATYCVSCQRHLPVGAMGEFVWLDNPEERVGT